MDSEKPHQCNCDHVTRCHIFTHPEPEIQRALNELIDAMSKYDDETGSASTLMFRSEHSEGVFTSVTTKEGEVTK